MNDAALVGLALTNPQQGFAAIYDKYGTSLYNYCHSILRSQADAGDALQESFVTVMGKLSQLRDPDKLRPWLYAIVRNQCFKQHRQRNRERPEDPFETGEEQTVMAASTAEPDGTGELVALVWAATAGLSDVDRSVLELNIRHELDGEALAESLGVSGPKCSVLLHRAKDRLKTAVGALIVSKVGIDACGDLATIVSGHDFNPLIRKRVARHITGCAICEETEHRHRPEAYLAALPLLPVPAGVRDGVLNAIHSATSTATEASQPEPNHPDPGQPEASQPEPNHADPGQAEPDHPDPGQPEPDHPDPGQAGSNQPDGLTSLENAASSGGRSAPPAHTHAIGVDQTVWNEAGFPELAATDLAEAGITSSRRTVLAAAAVSCVVALFIVLLLLHPFGQERTVVAGPAPLSAPTALSNPQFLPTLPPVPPTAVALALAADAEEPVNAAEAEPTPTPTTEPSPTSAPVAPPSPPLAQPTSTPQPTTTPTPTPKPSPTPTPTPQPSPTPTTTTTAPTPTTPIPTSTPPDLDQTAPTPGPVLVDFIAPTISSFMVSCDDPFIITVGVSDNLDSSPTIDLEVTWEDETEPGLPLTNLSGNTYRESVPRSELVGSRIDFFVQGTLKDSSGNTRIVALTDVCIIID